MIGKNMKENGEIRRCHKCALPETYPGVQFDYNGTCNYCAYFEIFQKRQEIVREQIGEEFTSIIEEAKKLKKRYDCLLCFSGGKDSTYLLDNLKKQFDLKILAYTLDNGFLSPRALENISSIPEVLDVDHIIFKPRMNILKKIFSDALTQPTSYPKEIISMMSPLCATCQGIVVGVTIKLANEKDIPLIFTGYTPAQYPNISFENFLKARSCIYFATSVHKDDPVDILRIIRDPVEELCGEEINNYYFKSQYLKEGEEFPKIIFPYHSLLNYDEEEIYDTLKDLGWKKPSDTDPCSTNCLINTLGNYSCLKQFSYHPYIGEMSSLVRSGLLSYKKALESEHIDEDCYAMNYSLNKLGLTKTDIIKMFDKGNNHK